MQQSSWAESLLYKNCVSITALFAELIISPHFLIPHQKQAYRLRTLHLHILLFTYCFAKKQSKNGVWNVFY